MIYLNLVGGLGNQLFEYAFARTIQIKTNQKICISTYEITYHDKKRIPTLRKFRLPDSVCFTEKKLPWYVHRRNYISKILRKVLEKKFFEYYQKRGSYIWYSEEFIKTEQNFKDNIYIGGYWQSEKYFKDAVNDIREEIIPQKISKKNMELVKKIESEKSICLHIRRGDYVGSPYQVCTVEYYNKAIELIRQYLDTTIYIFSDDVQWVKENICILGKKNFVEDKNPDYIDLYLMSKCHSFIISNSTFSWWAQELGSQKDKIVIAPNRWHTEKKCESIYLESWKLVDVEGKSGYE